VRLSKRKRKKRHPTPVIKQGENKNLGKKEAFWCPFGKKKKSAPNREPEQGKKSTVFRLKKKGGEGEDRDESLQASLS